MKLHPCARLIAPTLVFSLAFALSVCNAEPSTVTQSELRPITSDTAINEKFIEASGITHIGPDRYWLVSDETDQVLEMNKNGVITQTHDLEFSGKIDDLESISQLADSTLVCSSVNPTKSGKLKKSRRECLQFGNSPDPFKVTSRINLHAALENAAASNPDKTLKSFVKKALKQGNQDVEAHAFYQGRLLLGLKNPLLKNRAVILDVGNLEQLSQGKSQAANIWRTLDFDRIDPEAQYRLSDMSFKNKDQLLLTTSGKNKSAVWRYDLSSGELRQLRIFLKAQAEGVSYNPSNRQTVVVFDGGNGNGSSVYFYEE